jgi:flagellar basal-body rod protein FlgG
VGQKKVGAIKLVDVPAPNALLAVGSSLFVPTTASGAPVAARGAVIHQSQLEASNVNVAASMTDLLDAQQTYSLSSRALQTQDQLLSMANELRS